MPGVLLCCSMCQAHRGVLLAGILLCRSACQALKGAPWVGNYSVVLGIRHLLGQPLYCSAANAGVWGKRGYGDGPAPTRNSAVSPCFHGCPAFLHRHKLFFGLFFYIKEKQFRIFTVVKTVFFEIRSFSPWLLVLLFLLILTGNSLSQPYHSLAE